MSKQDKRQKITKVLERAPEVERALAPMRAKGEKALHDEARQRHGEGVVIPSYEHREANTRAFMAGFEHDRAEHELKRRDALRGDTDALLSAITEQQSTGMQLLREVERADYGNAQSTRASKPRSDSELDAIIGQLAKAEGTAKEKWSRLYASLDAEAASPSETATGTDMRKWRIDYTRADGKPGRITFGTFQNKLREARKS